MNFEQSLEKLQQIVKKLESGELPLEDALKQFEEGIKATRDCQKFLSDAEAKVEILTKTGPDAKATDTQNFKA